MEFLRKRVRRHGFMQRSGIVLAACALGVPTTLGAQETFVRASDTLAIAMIGPAGGSIELRGPVRVTFAPSTFALADSVTVFVTSAPAADDARIIFSHKGAGPGPYLAFDITVEADMLPQMHYELEITLTPSFLGAIPAGRVPVIMREVLIGSELELHSTYDELSTAFVADARLVRARVPKLPDYRLNRLYDVFIVGSKER